MEPTSAMIALRLFERTVRSTTGTAMTLGVLHQRVNRTLEGHVDVTQKLRRICDVAPYTIKS
jgi:hypothetical protein